MHLHVRLHIWKEGRKEMFYLTTHITHFIYGYMASRQMVKDHSDSEKGNPLPPHRLLFLINSKGSFICTFFIYLMMHFYGYVVFDYMVNDHSAREETCYCHYMGHSF